MATTTNTPRSQKKQSDFTGRQAQAEAAKAAAKKAEQEAQTAAAVQAEKEEFDNSVFDATTNPSEPTVIDDVVEVGVEMADDSVVVRVAEDIDNMTYGHRNNYTFKAGGKYKVPKAVAERLESLGLVWH